MRSRGTLLAVVLVAAGLYGPAVVGPPAAEESVSPSPDQLVAPAEASGHVWPHTSRARSVEGRTLALNVVVYGDPGQVQRILVDRTDANWSAVNPNETVTVSPWRPAHGSVRYTYVTSDRNATGSWTAADYQLEVGTYFGRRTHVRVYASPSGNWTALQAHTEYWDWFRVRHTVTGVVPGAEFVERDLRGEPFVANVSRSSHGHQGGGLGWWTVVDLLPAVVLAGAAVPLMTRRFSGSDAALPVALAGLVLGVRAWGLAAEALFSAVTPKLFVALGYPVLVAGPPALVAVLARDRPATRVAILAAVGLGTGIALDLAVVGVEHLPTRLVLHRVALVAALGLFARGVAARNRPVAWVGIVAWVFLLAAPLLGVA